MTLQDFNRAKEIEEERKIITSNIKELDRALLHSFAHPKDTHRFETQSCVFAEFICDEKFLKFAIQYYENEEARLNAEFEALGKEN